MTGTVLAHVPFLIKNHPCSIISICEGQVTEVQYVIDTYRFAVPYDPELIDDDNIWDSSTAASLQGGVITLGGKLLVSVYCRPDDSPQGSFGIYVYNVFTGEFYGAVPVDITRCTVYEELEGLAVSPPNKVFVNGSPVNIHFVVLDNDLNKDDVYFKHVIVPSLDDLFRL